MFRISEIARHFGLSRSTLLYYDRIGLLSPSGRSEAGYRLYSAVDKEKLARISSLRKAGLTIEDIRRILAQEENVDTSVLQVRMHELGENIRALQAQQRMLGKMLKIQNLDELPPAIDKHAWVEMLRAAGMDEAAMDKWHAEFECRSPDAHHRFLLSLGILQDEILRIRQHAARTGATAAQVESVKR